jgi:hypothetical protein
MTIALVVDVTVKEGSINQFLDVIEKDALGARQEPGCLRFGALLVLRFAYLGCQVPTTSAPMLYLQMLCNQQTIP